MQQHARVYSYLRFSDPSQAAGASSERQRAYAATWAREHGLVLDETLSMRDEGLSAYHQKHIKKGALGAFLRAIEEGQVPTGSVLVVEGLDRLSRAEPILAQGQLAEIIMAGLSVVTASDGKVYSRERIKANPMDLVQSLLVMIRAHEESETKSKRVRDSIRRQCLAWQAGTRTTPIRFGNTPGWLRAVGGRWEVIEERAEAVRVAVDLFRRGMGFGHIAKRLHQLGLATSAAAPTSGHLTRLISNAALQGDKAVDVDGERFELRGYYPALIERGAFAELQQLLAARSRRHVRGEIPPLLTGMGIAVCGYCGGPLKSQIMASKRRTDGGLADSQRRLQCVRINSGERCPVAGSCSAAPIERALITWCSDLVNLRSLYTSDRSTLPRSELTGAKAKLQQTEQQLARLTDALVASGEAPPATFVQRARELEAARETALAQVRTAEASIAQATRADLAGADLRWRALAEGVETLDYEARMQARQLVHDTFERIQIYHHGMRPTGQRRGAMDVVVRARGGERRWLRISSAGELLAGRSMAGGLR